MAAANYPDCSRLDGLKARSHVPSDGSYDAGHAEAWVSPRPAKAARRPSRSASDKFNLDCEALDHIDISGIDAHALVEKRIEARRLVDTIDPVNGDMFLVLVGLLARQIDDRRGNRQVTAIHLPGDLIAVDPFLPGRNVQNVAALINSSVAIIPLASLAAQATSAFITRLWQAAVVDTAIQQMWTFRIGRLNAVERVAHLLCELNERLKAVALSDGHIFQLKLTQADLAEMVGITQVHANRVLAQLRRERLCSFRQSMVRIPDPDALARRGQFNPAYLRTGAWTDGPPYLSRSGVGNGAQARAPSERRFQVADTDQRPAHEASIVGAP